MAQNNLEDKILTGIEVVSPTIGIGLKKLLGKPTPTTIVGKSGRALSYLRIGITLTALSTAALTADDMLPTNTRYIQQDTQNTVLYTAPASSLYVHSDNNF